MLNGLPAPPRTPGRSGRSCDRDISSLQRILALTNDGVSRAGVQRILPLEDELAGARSRIAELEDRVVALQREAEERVEAAHRQYRRELVPVRSAVVARFEHRR